MKFKRKTTFNPHDTTMTEVDGRIHGNPIVGKSDGHYRALPLTRERWTNRND